MKNFFNITQPYTFEWGDFDAITTILNFILIIIIGFKASFFGAAVAVFGIGRDLFIHRCINGLLIHITTLLLNLYFLMILFGKI